MSVNQPANVQVVNSTPNSPANGSPSTNNSGRGVLDFLFQNPRTSLAALTAAVGAVTLLFRYPKINGRGAEADNGHINVNAHGNASVNLKNAKAKNGGTITIHTSDARPSQTQRR